MKCGIARRELLAGAAGVLGAGAAWAEDGGVIDMTAPFWPVYDEGRGKPLADRADLLSRTALRRNLEGGELGASAKEIEAWLPRFDPLAEQARTMRRKVAPLWAANIERFAAALPGFRRTNKARLVMSRFAFAARCARIRDEYDVMIGIDECARLGRTSEEEIALSLAEQSFHAHHYFYNWRMKPTEITPLWLDLWFSGLGLYCAERMFPRADKAKLLGEARLAAAPVETLQACAAQMIRDLDIASEEVRERYFGKEGLGRAVALYMIEREGRTRALPDMVFIPARPARDIVLLELNALSP